MGVDLPTTSRHLLPSAAMARVVMRSGQGRRPLWLVGLAVLATVVGVSGVRAGAWPVLRALPWVLAGVAASLAWWGAGRRVRGRLRAASWLLVAAAVSGVLIHLAAVSELTAAPAPLTGPGLMLPVLPEAFMAAAAALALGWRRRRDWSLGVAADTLLLLLAAAVAVARWVVEPAVATGGGAAPDALVPAQLVAVAPVVPALLLVLHRQTALPPRAALFLLAALLVFAASSLALFAHLDPSAVALGDALRPADLLGWLLLAGSGLAAREPATTTEAMLKARRARAGLRKLLVPAMALLLAAAAVDVAMGARPLPATVAALAALGAVLALRTAQAFTVVDRSAAERRQLAHTQALVDVTHALAGTIDLDEALRVISESARAVLGTRGGGIELLTEDGRELVSRAAVGLPPEVLGLRFPVEGSFTGWVVRHGEPRASVDPSRDPYIQPQSLTFLGHQPVAAAPIRFRGETFGALFACNRSEPFEPEELHLLGALAEQAAIAIHNARLFEQVMTLSITDPLTGLANRRQLERELGREFAAARRGRSLCALIFDVDDFKDYNDAHGHLAGDEALQAFAATLRAETRAMNLAARYGGDEFVVLLADADLEGARAFLQRIRDGFNDACLALGRGPLTVSVGLATWSPDMEQPDELLRRADDELYRAKARLRT